MNRRRRAIVAGIGLLGAAPFVVVFADGSLRSRALARWHARGLSSVDDETRKTARLALEDLGPEACEPFRAAMIASEVKQAELDGFAGVFIGRAQPLHGGLDLVSMRRRLPPHSVTFRLDLVIREVPGHAPMAEDGFGIFGWYGEPGRWSEDAYLVVVTFDAHFRHVRPQPLQIQSLWLLPRELRDSVAAALRARMRS